MLRMFKLLPLAVLALLVMFTVSCEGPAGPAGADGVDGKDGADGNITCLGCHNEDTMLDNQLEMARSQHGLGDVAVAYAGGRASCAPCHGHEQFVEYVETGSVSGNVVTPSPWQCSTCHGLHRTFDESFGDSTDYALRTVAAVPVYYDETQSFDLGNSSNLCMNCHQARTQYAWASEDSASITSTHFGPHHGPQANLLFGVNGTIDDEPFSPHYDTGCTGCHMYETSGDEADINGGHTFWAAAEKCNDCHSGPDIVFDANRGGDDFIHEGHYDYKGFQTEIGEKLENLAGLLVTAGVLDSNHTVVPGKYPIAEFGAFWNWAYIEEDRSHGVHNPYYTTDLLDEAITALGGTP